MQRKYVIYYIKTNDKMGNTTFIETKASLRTVTRVSNIFI